MPSRIAFIARKEFQYFWLDWENYFWVFIMPVVFMYFIGTVTANFGGNPGGGKDSIALVAPADAGFLADQLALRLEQSGYEVRHAEAAEGEELPTRRLVVPAGFTASVLAGEKSVVTLESRGKGLSGDYDRVRASRAVYLVLADLVVSAGQGREPTAEWFAELAAMPRSVTIDVRPAGRRKEIPTGFEQAVPGIMIMFSLIVILTTTSSSLVIERRRGLLRRLASAPISKGEVFAGRWLARAGLGYVQVLLGLVAGTFLFGVDWGPNLGVILVVLLGWSALCASLGLLLGNLVQTEGQGVGISVLAANVLCALGGQWWPIEIAPSWMQKLAMFLPNGWTMDALHQLALFGAGPLAVVPHLLGLLAAAGVVAVVGMRTFRFE